MSTKAKLNVNSKTPSSRRDNFTQAVIQILYKRAGGKCCRCAASTFGPVSNNPLKSVNIGQAAHIAAAAPLGPRYSPTMTLEERTSATNGMWMCSNCHDIIDRDVDEYPTCKLKKLKHDAERRAKNEMGVASHLDTAIQPQYHLAAGVSATTIVEIRKSKSEILDLNGSPIDQDLGENLLSAVSFINPELDNYLPEVGQELMVYFDQLVAYCNNPVILLEVIRRLKILTDAFHRQWSKRDVEQISELAHKTIQGKGKRSRVYQSATALLKDLSRYSELEKKNLHTIPSEYLKGLRGRDLVDGDTDLPTAKRFHEDYESNAEDDHYLELMEQLSTCKDSQEVERIETELNKMGYEPNIV